MCIFKSCFSLHPYAYFRTSLLATAQCVFSNLASCYSRSACLQILLLATALWIFQILFSCYSPVRIISCSSLPPCAYFQILLPAATPCVISNLASRHNPRELAGQGRLTLRTSAPGKYSREGGSAESLSGRWFRETTLWEAVRQIYSPESGSEEITLREVVRPNYSREGGSGNYSPESGSAELPSGK